MRKVLFLAVMAALTVQTAKADTIIVMDDNNNVKQQIYTLPNSVVKTVQTVQTVPVAVQTPPVYVTGAPLPPQQVIVTRPVPPVVVVRETPAPRNYYYDSVATSAVAGFTGALVGSVIFGGGHHHHHHHRR